VRLLGQLEVFVDRRQWMCPERLGTTTPALPYLYVSLIVASVSAFFCAIRSYVNSQRFHHSINSARSTLGRDPLAGLVMGPFVLLFRL
jgi:hypothetical protein